MLQRALKAEWMKLKHSPIIFAFLIIPIISVAMGTFNYWANKDILTEEWYSLWTQHTIFYCYLCCPTLIGVYCAYVCRIEHLQNNWKSVLVEPVKVEVIYGAKLLVVAGMLGCTQIFIGVLYFISGKLVGFNAKFPSEVVIWLVLGTIAGISIAALQLTISLKIRSFAIPVGISLAGGIMGLMILAAGYAVGCPYSLLSVGMCANDPMGGLAIKTPLFIAVTLGFTLCFSGLGIYQLKRKMMA